MRPSFLITVHNEVKSCPVSLKRVRETVCKILQALGWKKARLSILFVTDRKIRAINRKYLNHDRPTDVIAFSQLEGPKLKELPQGIPVLGDIVISLDTAGRQALVYGNTFFYELSFYLCHGILHILGYCDKTKKEALGMEKRQEVILKKIGIQNG